MLTLSGDLIRHKLPTYIFGQNVLYTPSTGSTNSELKKFARQGAPEGMLYITDKQMVGRGRLERGWMAPAGSGLLMSLLFKPDFLNPAKIQQLTMMCSLAMVDAIKKHTDLATKVKWPNDLVWHNGKKLGGILTETEFEGDSLNWAVIGLGLNVNVDFSRHTKAEPDRPGKPGSGHAPLAQTATSLSMILGRDTDNLRLPILQSYLRNVEQRYEALRREVLPHFEWQRKLADVGQAATVTLLNGNTQIQGIITGVDENGSLRLRQANGLTTTISAGDVTLR